MAKEAAAGPSILVLNKEWNPDRARSGSNVNLVTISQIWKLKTESAKEVERGRSRRASSRNVGHHAI